MKKSFAELQPRGQAARLNQLAQTALSQYDLPSYSLHKITNDFNAIYRVDCIDGRRFILRIALPEGGHGKENHQAEMDFLDALARETLLIVPRPQSTRDGNLFTEVQYEGIPDPRLCALFGYLQGRNLGDHLTPINTEKQGRLMAEIHHFSAQYTLPANIQIPYYDRVFYFPEPVVLMDDPQNRISDTLKDLFQKSILRAEAAITRLQKSGEAPRVLHGDLHQWNILFHNGRCFPIDFEDLTLGWPVQDIGIALYYLTTDPEYPKLRSAFQRGYEHILPWPEKQAGEVDAFIAGRGANLANFILQSPLKEDQDNVLTFLARMEKRFAILFGS
jgi:Ser/Thr protein kinase RdoA (MazF antagonist)